MLDKEEDWMERQKATNDSNDWFSASINYLTGSGCNFIKLTLSICGLITLSRCTVSNVIWFVYCVYIVCKLLYCIYMLYMHCMFVIYLLQKNMYVLHFLFYCFFSVIFIHADWQFYLFLFIFEQNNNYFPFQSKYFIMQLR